MKRKRTRAYVVPHTHWDREWYQAEHRSRQRLVYVVDDLLDLLVRDDRLTAFVLDGQVALIEDYLALRPERAEAIQQQVEAGRLLIGPWYTLSDELLSSAESLVRNLLVGRRVASGLGGVLELGYSPDAFGHPEVLPTILNGFGLKNCILWRGYGGEPGQEDDLFVWAAPDGSFLYVHHLPPAGYEFGAEISAAEEELIGWFNDIMPALRARANGRPLLIMNGADHHAAQPDIADVVQTLNKLFPDYSFEIAEPGKYFREIAKPDESSPVTGELRFSYRYTWTLQGVHSTRSKLKGLIAEGDTLLTRWTEPQAALVQASGRTRAPVLLEAWKMHLKNHAHDSFGGCAIDKVSLDVAERAKHVIELGQGLFEDAVLERLGQDPVRARRNRDRWDPHVAIINPTPRERSAVVEMVVTRFVDDIVVGKPGMSPVLPVKSPLPLLLDARTGEPLPVQHINAGGGYERLDSPHDYPDQDLVVEHRLAVKVSGLAPGGIVTAAVRDSEEDGEVGGGPAPDSSVQSIQTESVTISTDTGRGGRGGFCSLDHATGVRLPGLGTFEDLGDNGDTYTFESVPGDRPAVVSWGDARASLTGPLVYELRRPFQSARVTGEIVARAFEGSKLVQYRVLGDNLDGGHRLRFLVPVPHGGKTSIADMHYGPVVRERKEYDPGQFPLERPVDTAPMHRYVLAPLADGAIIVMVRGRYEYELTDDGALAVTLFRSVSELSRGDLKARPGHAGWPAPTPGAEELGRFEVEIGVAVVEGAESPGEWWDSVESLSEEFHLPPAYRMLRWGIDVPPVVAGPEFIGSGFSFKSLKPAESGTGFVLRVVNLLDEANEAAWELSDAVTRVFEVRLDETPMSQVRLDRDRRRFRFTAGPREVVSFLVET